MISDQNIGREKPGDKLTQQEVVQVTPAVDQESIIQWNHGDIQLH